MSGRIAPRILPLCGVCVLLLCGGQAPGGKLATVRLGPPRARAGAHARTADKPPTTYVARTERAPKIDGKPDESPWAKARPLALARSLDGSAPAPVATQIRLLHDKDNLYVAVRAAEPLLDKVRAPRRGHDGAVWTDDSVEIFLGRGGDYWHFAVSASGCTYDGAAKDGSWNAGEGFRAAAGRGKGEWTAEVAIPLKVLAKAGAAARRAGGALPAEWTANFNRNRYAVGRLQESSWSPTRSASSHVPERFGRMLLGKPPARAAAGGQQLRLIATADARTVLEFDLSALPAGAKVHWADLRLRRTAALDGRSDQARTNIEVYPVTGAVRTGQVPPKPGGKPLAIRGPWYDRLDATAAVAKAAAGGDGDRKARFLIHAGPLLAAAASVLDVAYEGPAENVPRQVTGVKVVHRAGQTFITWNEIADPVGSIASASPPSGKDQVRWGEMKDILRRLDAGGEVRYCVYRSDRPIDADSLAQAECIAQVSPLSGWNLNARNKARPKDEVIARLEAAEAAGKVLFWVEGASGGPDECPIERFVIAPGANRDTAAAPLGRTTGLYVHTAAGGKKVKSWYAVATMVDGVQNTVDFGAANAPPRPVVEQQARAEPVLQRRLPKRPVWDYRHTRYQYVQWTAPPLGNLPSRYYNWLVCVPDRPAKTYPAELNLPQPGNSWYRAPYRIESDSIIAVPHDWPLQTWYWGHHECEGTLKSFAQGTVHNYTQRRILAFLDWLGRTWPVDRNRMSVAGNGLLAGSGALHLGLAHHQMFNLVMCQGACPDFRGAILKFRQLGDVRKVPNVNRTFRVKCPEAEIQRLMGKVDWDLKADTGRSIWDELSLTRLVRSLPASTDLPVVTYAGKGGFEHDRDFRLAMLDKGHLLIANFNVYGNRFFIPISATGALTGMIQQDIRKDLSHPAFRGPGCAVLLKPPVLATGELVVSDGTLQWWGTFNERYRWSDIVDRPDRYEITLQWHGRGAGTSDVVLRRCRKFRPRKGQVCSWQFKADLGRGREIAQEGKVTPGEDGLLRVPQVRIAGAPGRLVITAK